MPEDVAALIRAEIERRRREASWAEVQRLFTAGDDRASFEVFCHDLVTITTKVPGQTLPLRWTEIQTRFNRGRSGLDIVLKCRQIGLTTNELARDLHFALLRPNVCVAVVAQAHKKNEPVQKLVAQLRFLIDHLGVDTGDHWSGSKVTFGNGSSITIFDCGGSEEAADKQGRGGTYHRVHLTESAFYKYGDQVIGALLNALPSPELGGECVEESTPNGAYGRFYLQVHAAAAGTNGYRLHFFPWMLQAEYALGHPLDGRARPETPQETELVTAAAAVGVALTQAQLRWWRREVTRKGLDRTLQEFPHDPEKCFLLPGSSYFDLPAVDRLKSKAREPLDLTKLASASQSLAKLVAELNREEIALRIWEPPSGEDYLLVVDTAGGRRRGDWPVGLVFGRRSRRHVATYRHKIPPSEFARRVAKVAQAFGEAEICVERNNHGGTVLVTLEEQVRYRRIWTDDKGDAGFWTGPHNRLVMIDDLVDAVTQGTFHTWDAVFSAEARTFIRWPDGWVGAAVGTHDDVVMAAAIARAVLGAPPSFSAGGNLWI